MRIRRIFGWSGVALLVALLVAAGVLYILSTCQPGRYKPAELDDQQRKRVAQEFVARRVIKDFGESAGQGQPFEWSISEDDLNNILASMDEIANQLDPRGAQDKPVQHAMGRMSIYSPAASFQPGQISLMVYSEKYKRVLSADLGMHMTGDGKLKVSLDGSRVGQMPLPGSVVQEQLERLRQALPRKANQYEHVAARGLSPEDFALVIHQVLQAIDGQPFDPVLTWPDGKRKVRIDSIEISDSMLKMHMTPLAKP